MSKPEPAGGPTPELFFQTANAYQRSQALKAAVELDLFTAVGLGHDDPDALAERCKAAPRGMRILADYLTIQGFLTKEGTRYKLTPDSAVFLIGGHPPIWEQCWAFCMRRNSPKPLRI